MSWDADLVCDCCGSEMGEWNFTHNTNPMVQEARRSLGHHVDSSWWEVLDGMPGATGAQYLSEIITGLEAGPDRYRAMNPPNGWGSYDRLLEVLREMRDRVGEHPTTWRCSG